MDIYLSGDIRKDKRVDGYVLNANHYPNFLYFSGVSSIGSGAQYYNVVLDAFDYSGNFIERKAAFYNRGSNGAGIDIYWNKLQSKDNWYTIYPSIGLQYNNYSDIENRMVDYRC
jgi:hypothetical protein